MSDVAHDRRDGRVHLRVAQAGSGAVPKRLAVAYGARVLGPVSKRDLELGRRLFPPSDHGRPKTRGECASVPRPCPFVSCAHHLYLDVNQRNGSIMLNYLHLEPWEMSESCSLDVAEQGAVPLDEVGGLMNMTGEAVRLVQHRALRFLQSLDAMAAIAREFGFDTRPVSRRGNHDEDD